MRWEHLIYLPTLKRGKERKSIDLSQMSMINIWKPVLRIIHMVSQNSELKSKEFGTQNKGGSSRNRIFTWDKLMNHGLALSYLPLTC